MIQNINKNNKISFLFSKSKSIDLDALNLLAGESEQILCCCSYYEYDGRHRLDYDVWVPNNMYLQKDSFELGNLFCACLALFEVTDKYKLNLANFKIQSKYIFNDKDKYQFIYIPVVTKKQISKKAFIIKLLLQFRKKDLRIVDFIREIRRMKPDVSVLDILEEYMNITVLQSKSINSEGQCNDSDEETTILSENENDSESDTTLLTNNSEVEELDTEGETTILNEHTTEFLTSDSAECETTFLSDKPLFGSEKKLDLNAECTLFLLRVGTGEQIHINKPEYSIGKDIRTMDYVLGNQSVSRNHATIYIEENKFYLTDNGSTNGTTIEGIRVQAGERAELSDGDVISLGNEVFQVLLERK